MSGQPRTAAAERARRLYEHLKHCPFWCDTCHGWHPLEQHRDCRAAANQAAITRARAAIPGEEPHA